ncbi:MAG: hypothetical protein KF730_11005 [Sphingomonas sp.]|uniref:hypothetical protein n=1 Tax=Sphingomonas sp. TaxID=28214 RepID=UPI0025D0E890|nr:hypothetical protein [Sphingomonas sp.]MBX3565088.1 hypothetical protein [Sphingomonas sp.]
MSDTDHTDTRSDLERAVQSRADEANGGGDTSALKPTGVKDGIGGTAGEDKNQGRDQQ